MELCLKVTTFRCGSAREPPLAPREERWGLAWGTRPEGDHFPIRFRA